MIHWNVFYFSEQYLTCLKTSRSLTDKLSFDVGLQEDSIGTLWLHLFSDGEKYYGTFMVKTWVPTGEPCWWTIHPASKQRSEGEKVRIGDDLILVSVSTERYLVSHIIKLSCYGLKLSVVDLKGSLQSWKDYTKFN